MEDNNQESVTQEEVGVQTQEEALPSESEREESPQEETQDAGNEQSQEDQDLTEKGTKKAKEPESQFYQKLRNENSELKQREADMRSLLSDPNAMREYLRQVEGTQAPKEGEKDELADIVKQATREDGQVDATKLTKLMDERTTRQIEDQMKRWNQQQDQASRIQRAYDSEKSLVRAEHPELDQTKKDVYDPELEQFIGERFLAQGGIGRASLKQVVDDTYAYLEKFGGKARAQAETEVVKKQAGAVNTSRVSGDAKDSDESLSPEQILAQRVQQAISKR